MDDLTEFLRERLAEDEAAARAAAYYDDGAKHDVPGPPGTWVLLPDRDYFGSASVGGVVGPRIGYANHTILGGHIARHNPARVLAEVEAKRRMLRHYESAAVSLRNTAPGSDLHHLMTGAVNTVRAILLDHAAVYSDHPGFRSEWASGLG